MMIFLFVLFLQQPTYAHTLGNWWKGFCERHLIAEHPYQEWVRTLTTKEIVMEFRRKAGQQRWRRDPDPDEYEMVLVRITERYPYATEEEKQLIRDALEDYPDPRIQF